jgi:hypothetical protein
LAVRALEARAGRTKAAAKLIDEAHQRGYQAGVVDGKADFQMRDITASNDAFERGRRKGWRQGGDQVLDEVHAALHGGREIRDAD